jgi:hypothetical protein
VPIIAPRSPDTHERLTNAALAPLAALFGGLLMRAGSRLRTARHERTPAELARRALALVLLAPVVHGQSPAAAAAPVARGELCVTEGAIAPGPDGSLTVGVPKMRAFVMRPVADAIAVHLTYQGPTSEQSALGSGELRGQFALKPRALDACNLLYVTWRLTPAAKLVVQVKNNPRQHSSPECSNHGYHTLKPRLAAPLPQLAPGDTRLMRAEISAATLRVFVDGNLVWEGELGEFADLPMGPVGVRSDNVRAAFRLEAGPGTALTAAQLPACRAGVAETE